MVVDCVECVHTSSVLWSARWAGVAELVDAADSKSAALAGVGVRFPLPALGGRLMAGQRVLVPRIGVQVPAPQLQVGVVYE